MSEYRYKLEKGSKKFTCPNCDKKKFVRYIDFETGEYIPSEYGRCDRESKCSYHLSPYANGYAAEQSEPIQKISPIKRVAKKPVERETVYFDLNTFKETLNPIRYGENVFLDNLLQVVGANEVAEVTKMYRLGTVANGYRAGAVTFPFIDENNSVRAVQVKQFNEDNHTTGTDFLHSIIEKHYRRKSIDLPKWLKSYLEQEKRVSCLFGEHLLPMYPNNPIALVEAPKTAIYGTLYFGLPKNETDLLWIAVYNKSSFSFDKLKVLKGRDVLVFPDLSKDGSTFKEWQTKAKEYEKRLKNTSFLYYDLLERIAPKEDREDGKDLADYLIQQDWLQFKEQSATSANNDKGELSEKDNTINRRWLIDDIDWGELLPTKEPEPLKWDAAVLELENFFQKINLPTEPIQLNQCSKILNCILFVENHLNTVKRYNGNHNFEPYLIRLQQFKEMLTNK